MSKLIAKNSGSSNYFWVLYDDCIVFNNGKRVSMWNAYACPVTQAGKTFDGKPVYGVQIVTNCMGMNLDEMNQNKLFKEMKSIWSEDKEKLERVVKHINSNSDAPDDLPISAKGEIEAKTEKFQKKEIRRNTVIELIAAAIVVILVILFCNNCTGNNNSSGKDWDDLSSHQQEVAREAHDYKEALDGMK